MSSLVGAWSLDGPIGRRLPAARRRLLRGTGEGLCEIESDRLWLCAPADRVIDRGDVVVAGEGFLADPGLPAAVDDVTSVEGQFCLARHDRSAGTLTLVRSLSGGERLYYARPSPGLVLFASAIRPLLAVVGARLRRAVVDEVLLTGLTMFGTESLHEDIDEVLPGHELRAGAELSPQRFFRPDALTAPVGDPEALARQFRDRLTEAVAASAGPGRPVAVALSGGIDSSAIAVAAVNAFGADQVRAIAYEFDDPGHSSELTFASQVAARLGIRRHHVFALTLDDYLAAIPEMIHRSESLVHWPKAFMLPVAREIARLGHDRYLTGFGIGSHLAYLDELARGVRVAPRAVTAPWRRARFSGRAWPHRLARLHPCLEVPHPRLYYLVGFLLAARGIIADPRALFPSELGPLIDNHRPIGDGDMDLPLGPWLQRRALSRGIACIDVTRSEKASRELGVYRISPAHFDRCVPYAHFPFHPRPRLYGAARALRPGKHLLRLAYRHVLPDEVLYRVKSWGDAVASDAWLRAGRRLMLSVLPGFPGDFGEHGAHYPDAIRFWESRSILATGLALRLWIRLFVELPDLTRAPTWQALWQSLQEQRQCA